MVSSPARRKWVTAALFFASVTGNPDLRGQMRPLEPLDVLTVAEIDEVQLAPDGSQVAFATTRRDPLTNRTLKSFWLVQTHGGAAITAIEIDTAASDLRWRPDGEAVSYIAPDSNGISQIWETTGAGGTHVLTGGTQPVVSYEWSNDGSGLAFATSRELPGPLTDLGAGVVVDMVRFFHQRLLSKEPLEQRSAHDGDPRTRIELWIYDLRASHTRLVSGEMSVTAYAWSPTGRALALTAHRRVGRLPTYYSANDLLLYTLANDDLETLERGAGGDYLNDTVVYDLPFWSPDASQIGFFRTDARDRWAASPQLGVYSLAEMRTTLLIPDDSLETYRPRALWLHPDTILIETIHRAERRLLAVALPAGSFEVAHDRAGWFDQHSFSADASLVAFVHERIDVPAELYVSDRAMRKPRRLTHLQRSLVGVSPPRVERLRWVGEDGMAVEGWLYLPRGEPPFPTIVFVHGGPTWVYRNRYEPYVSYWPHALGVYAARGIAVLAPNYRGTGSYGKAFRRRSALDAEPVSDIVAGLDTIIDRGIVDTLRLGIAGHSHGCWLAALIAVRYRRFAAGACADSGMGNVTSTYARNAGWANEELVEHYWGGGASPYDEPERYRKLSPVYEFRGLRTPFLFEAGDRAQVMSMLEYATAAWRAGVPHELVIYSNTGHNVVEPQVMLEVMRRNLEWFEFWLRGREKQDEAKLPQYQRWRRLRERIDWGTSDSTRPPVNDPR